MYQLHFTTTAPHLTTSPHLTSPHLTSPHLTSPHLTSPHFTTITTTTVSKTFKLGFDIFVASQGYIVAQVDGRGTSTQNGEFMHSVYRMQSLTHTPFLSPPLTLTTSTQFNSEFLRLRIRSLRLALSPILLCGWFSAGYVGMGN